MQPIKAPVNTRDVHFIVNKAAGQPEEIEQIIHRIYADSGLEYAIHAIQEGEDIAAVVQQIILQTKIVAVYGGDGSVTRVAAAMAGSSTPLAIIPGGTANVLSKELGIPQDTEEALQLLRDGRYELRVIDTGSVNDTFFLLRVNLGIMADMILNTEAESKKVMGQLAYGITTIKSISEAEPVHYTLDIDGEIIETDAVSLTVTNAGSAGIGGLQMQPGISISDGLLDVILLKDASMLSMIKTVGSSLFNYETDAVSHWSGREITITMPGEQPYICDDCDATADRLHIRIVPASLTVVVPVTKP